MLRSTLALLACAGSATALADSAEAPIEEITVEAAKLPVATNNLASRVSLIDNEQIRAQLAQNIDELVRYEPGVDVVDQGSRFGFSGISIRGIGGNRVKLEVDGVPVADAFSIGSFSNASRDFVDVNNLRQVEILRGPASATFGSDAIGGVVSFITQRPRDVLGERNSHFDLTAGYNSVNTGAVLSGTYAAKAGGTAGMLQATLREGEERNVGIADPHDEQSRNVLARVDFGDALAGGLGLTFEHFGADSVTEVDSLEGVQDFSQAFGFPYVVDTSVVRADDRRERARASVGQEWLAGKFGTSYLRWRAYYQSSNTTQDTFEARETTIAGSPGAVERNRRFEFDQNMYGIEINAASDFTTGRIQHQLAYGLEFEQADTEQLRSGTETDLLTSETSNRVGPDLYPLRDFPKSTTRRSGIYIEDHISLGPISLLPGLRWDRYQLTPDPDDIFTRANPGIDAVSFDDDQFSPKLGVLWQLTGQTQLYAQYAEGFRAPPVNDVNVGFRNVQFGYTALPNPDLVSESSRGYEVGFRYAGPNARWDIAAFTTRYDDFIQSLQVVGIDRINQLLLFQSVNVDKVEIRGAEFSASFTPSFLADGWRIDTAIAYAEGEDRLTGQAINSVAPLNGVLGVAFDHGSDRWGASFITRGAEQQDDLDETDGELLSPAGYVVFDTLAWWRPTANTRLRAGVYNLTDEAYTAYLDVQGVPADTPFPERFQRPGREMSIAFDWTF